MTPRFFRAHMPRRPDYSAVARGRGVQGMILSALNNYYERLALEWV